MARLRLFFSSITGRAIVVILLISLGTGLGVFLFQTFLGTPKIALIRAENIILWGSSVEDIVKMLQIARDDRSYKGVVLTLDTPGGGAAASEEVLIQVLELRRSKPVVASLGEIAASGGYMIAVGTDYIYAKPTSFVGNVGAILFLPGSLPPFEDLAYTGPYKLTGGTNQNYIAMLEMIKDAFVKTVVTHRGSKLRIPSQEVAEGRIYTGIEAVRNGMVDEIGSTANAARKAAFLAGVKRYKVVDLLSELKKERSASLLGASAEQKASRPANINSLLGPSVMEGYHRIMLLYVEPPK